MKIAVCIKQVPASESKIRPSADGKDIDRRGLSFVVSPYDEFGLEEALKIKENCGEGTVTVTVLTLGPGKAQEALRTCLAVGADEAIHIKDEAFEGGDSYATALVLSEALKREVYDLIFFGKQAIDDDSGAVGIQVAEMLGLPHVAVINKLEVHLEAKRALAHRQIEGALEVIETSLPAIFTCQKELNEPRYASLPGIMKARKKPLSILNLSDLGLGIEAVGSKGAKTGVEKISAPPSRASGVLIAGDPPAAVKELIRLFREEVKVL